MGDMPGIMGPSNWVDPVTYRRIKKGIHTKKRKTKKRKRTSRKGNTYNSSGGDVVMGGQYPMVIRGRGGYWGDMWNKFKSGVPSGTFANVGENVGNVFGAGALGRHVGQLAAKLSGFGAYNVNMNTLLEGGPVPTFQNMGQGVIVCHREYIGDVSIPSTPATFTAISYPINPGLDTSFPWLSSIACQFDQYRILGMVYEFKSTCSDSSGGTTLALGSVILSTDYDSADQGYASKLEMENAQYTMSSKPSLDVLHPIECDPSITPHEQLYVRHGPVPSGKDARLYDHGVFQIATAGLPTGSSGLIGELWCTYQVEFYKPQLFGGALNGGENWDHFNLSTGISSSNYLDNSGNAVSPTSSSTLGGTIIGSSYYFPANLQAGKYLIFYSVNGASTTLTSQLVPGGSGYTGASALTNIFAGNTVNFTRAPAALVSGNQYIAVAISISTRNCVWSLTAGTLPGTITSGDLHVMQMPLYTI